MTRLDVRDVRAPLDAVALASMPSDARLQWREPLMRPDLDRIEAWLATRPLAAIRLYGRAAAQANVASHWPPFARLEIHGSALDGALAPIGVRELVLDGIPKRLDALQTAFPGLETLRIVARGAAVDADRLTGVAQLQRLSLAAASVTNCAAFSKMPALRAIELRAASLDDANAVMRCDGLHALRLSKIAGLRSIEAFSGRSNLRVLALEHLLHLESLAPIERLARLESLDLGGLWQFGVADAAFIPGMSSLRFLSIDIGGKRKNVEIYKRSAAALPVAFDISRYDLTTSNESGVQSRPAWRSSVTTKGTDFGLRSENGGV